jgi:hypothetical protein
MFWIDNKVARLLGWARKLSLVDDVRSNMKFLIITVQ